MTPRIAIQSFTYQGGIGVEAKATLALCIDGKTSHTVQGGVGPVDAAFKAVDELIPFAAELKSYVVHGACPGSSKVNARVTVEVSLMGRKVSADREDPDTVVASVRAYVAALNQHYS